MDENEQRQQNELSQQAQTAARKQESPRVSALCKHCGAALEEDSPFCPSCGEKADGKEHCCEFCQTKTTKEFCPHCNRRVIPVKCPKCGTLSVFDVCEECGTILNPVLEASLKNEKPSEPQIMSAEEVRKIEEEFKVFSAQESAEFKAFQKKLIERQILLEERDYFNKREKRIIKAFGSRPFALELPDPEEEAFRIKSYAALEKTVIARQEKTIAEELEKKFPPLPPVKSKEELAEEARLGELTKQYEEMEKRYRELLTKTETEVDAFREEERRKAEEERKRLEEERRKAEEARLKAEEERRRQEEAARRERERLIELERQRLEREREANKVNGSYYYRNPDFEMTLTITGKTNAHAYYNCFVCGGHAYLDFTVTYDGTNVYLHCSRFSGDTCGITNAGSETNGHNDDRLNFHGSLNSSGTMLCGYWGNGSGSFRSQFWGGADSGARSGTFYKQ